MKDKEELGKFDTKSDIGILLGYSLNSKAYKVYNLRTSTIMVSINIVMDDSCVEVVHKFRHNKIFRKGIESEPKNENKVITKPVGNEDIESPKAP